MGFFIGWIMKDIANQKDPDIIKYLDSGIVGIVETKTCETDNMSLKGYSLISKTNRPRLQYENTPIQIYRKFHHRKKMKIFK